MRPEQTIYNFHDIVPKPKGPTFAEKHLPTFLGLVQRIGYCQPVPETEVERGDFSTSMTVNMPEIPYGNGGHEHPLLYFFEQAGELMDRVSFTGDQEREFRFRMDRPSLDRMVNVPHRGDDSMFGDAMYHTIALFDYASEWFAEQGYSVTSVGIGSDNDFKLEITRA